MSEPFYIDGDWEDWLKRPNVREASDDEHFYGAWQGGSKASGGHPMRGGLRQDTGKPHDATIATNVRLFRQSGGKVKNVTIRNEAQGALNQVHAMEQVLGKSKGIDLAIGALTLGRTNLSGKQLVVARGATGVAGALLAYKATNPFMGGPVRFISMAGSVGIVHGTGSAMFREVVRKAASEGRGITLNSLPDAEPFWLKMGMRHTGGSKGSMGMTAAEVQRLNAALG